MLGRHPVDVMLLATDLGVARRFYGDTLGLAVLLADEQFLAFGCGGDSRLAAGAGVQVQDLPELGTVDGVADLGFALAAWLIDPDHNWIGLLQLKDPGVRPRGAATSA